MRLWCGCGVMGSREVGQSDDSAAVVLEEGLCLVNGVLGWDQERGIEID